jgi:hypothetical protein
MPAYLAICMNIGSFYPIDCRVGKELPTFFVIILKTNQVGNRVQQLRLCKLLPFSNQDLLFCVKTVDYVARCLAEWLLLS